MSAGHSRFPRVVEEVAGRLGLPAWWVESVAAEYADCRESTPLAGRDVVRFDFGRVTEQDLEREVRHNRVVVRGMLFHNVALDVLKPRLLMALIGAAPAVLPKDPSDLIPEGLASTSAVPFYANSLDVDDPKCGFSTHFQVLDNGRFWQWRVADFVSVPGRSFGKFVSEEVDLVPLDDIHDRLVSLREARKGTELGAYKCDVEEFYRWLDEIRRPIFAELERLHQQKRDAARIFPKAIKKAPPILSHYERFTVMKHDIHTRLYAEGIFFRSCLEHACRARALFAATKAGSAIDALDRVYEARAMAIIAGAACCEAYFNGVGYERIPAWSRNERSMDLLEKWRKLTSSCAGVSATGSSRESLGTLCQLKKCRNELIHYKPRFRKVVRAGGAVSTVAESLMPRAFSEELPARIEQLIRGLCQATGEPAPPWLDIVRAAAGRTR
jgi:hypothetical protein